MMEGFARKHDFLVIVNAEGSVMDTVNRRHFHCYGPCLVMQWALEPWRVAVLERWNQVNLLHITRGISPYKALAMVLSEVDRLCTPIPGVEALRSWAESAPELSDSALMQCIAVTQQEDRQCLEKALAWSKAAQEGIAHLPAELKAPFPGAREGLAAIHDVADVAVLSNEPHGGLTQEWSRHGLLEYTDVLLTPEMGSKLQRVAAMMKFGYQPDHVLVVGDTPQDWDAAELNGVGFFPIVVNRERESWQVLWETGLPRLLSLDYQAYQPEAKERFLAGLGAI